MPNASHWEAIVFKHSTFTAQKMPTFKPAFFVRKRQQIKPGHAQLPQGTAD